MPEALSITREEPAPTLWKSFSIDIRDTSIHVLVFRPEHLGRPFKAEDKLSIEGNRGDREVSGDGVSKHR
jgi:hypothetical protein